MRLIMQIRGQPVGVGIVLLADMRHAEWLTGWCINSARNHVRMQWADSEPDILSQGYIPDDKRQREIP